MKNNRFYNGLALLAGSLLLLAGCADPPNYPIEPEIEYISTSPTTVVQAGRNATADTVRIRFSFTDGDGDLGFEDNEPKDIILTDSRDGLTQEFSFPVIPEQGVGNGISGEATVLIVNNASAGFCCTFPNGAPPCTPSEMFPTDTVSFTLQIRDRAGNLSNKVQTERITILCQ